jgi:predicted permease
MDALWQDVRYALRALARSPGFTAIGVLVLALAIGVNTAIFSLVNALIFVKPNVPRAGELRYITLTFKDPRFGGATYLRELHELRAMHPLLENAFGFRGDSIYIGDAGHQRTVRGEQVTANYFDVLGIRPQIGRTFLAEDDRVEAQPVIVISDALWRAHFAGDPHVIGRTLTLAPASRMYPNARVYTIVGVAPAGFKGIADRFFESHFWAPHVLRTIDSVQYSQWRLPSTARRPLDPVNRSFIQIALRVPSEAGDRALAPVLGEATRRFKAARMHETSGFNPQYYEQFTLELGEHRRNRLPFSGAARIVPTRMAAALMIAAGAVLLIAVANLGGILGARGMTRRGEMAIRTTLGAGWRRLSRQLLVESLLVSAAGALAGIAIAKTLVALMMAAIPRTAAAGFAELFTLSVPMDARVLAFTAICCLVAALIVTIAPIRQALARDLLDGLSDGQVSAPGRRRTRLHRLVVVPQVCVSLVLIVVAGVLIRGVLREETAYRGYDSSNVLVAEFWVENLPRMFSESTTREERDAERAEVRATALRVAERARSVPGVDAAAISFSSFGVPLAMSGGSLVDRDRFSATPTMLGTRRLDVSEEYFDVLRIELRQGRLFDTGDTPASPKVAIVDESLAWHLSGGDSAVGKYVSFWFPGQTRPPDWLEVVGVVASVARPLEEGARMSTIYTPFSQGTLPATGLALRTTGGDIENISRALRESMAAVGPRVTVREIQTMDEAIATLYFPRRVAAGVLGAAGLAGLVLACIGIYGVVSYSVAQRVREIGIRAALGADRRDIMRLIVREGARLMIAGGVIGGVLTFAAMKLTSSKVVALPQTDAITLAIAPLVLALAMLLATYIPARRAASVDPMIALRRL